MLELSHGDDNNNTNYIFTFGGFGRCTQVKAGTRTLVPQTWAANNRTITKAKYGNNWEAVYTRDSEDRVTKLTATHTYDAGGMRTRKVSGGVTTDYTYAGNLLMAEKKGENCQRYFYEASGILCAISYNGHTFYYIRDGLMNITDIINVGGTSVVHYTYDAWGKILSITGSMASTLGHEITYNKLRKFKTE